MVEWSGKPAYQQVAEKLRERIAAGEYNDSGQIPSLAQIQSEYEVSVTVAREAVRTLRADGLVVSHQGKAAFLAPGAKDLAVAPRDDGEVTQLRQDLTEVRDELRELRERVSRLEGGPAN